jgi:hypothetical protein
MDWEIFSNMMMIFTKKIWEYANDTDILDLINNNHNFKQQNKCGKTIVTSVLMSLCLEKKVLELERISDEPMKVMWFDTEQSKSTTHHILSHRISNLITNEEAHKALDSHIFVFNVRTCTYQERMASYSCLCS